jgi:hypothetical protein
VTTGYTHLLVFEGGRGPGETVSGNSPTFSPTPLTFEDIRRLEAQIREQNHLAWAVVTNVICLPV